MSEHHQLLDSFIRECAQRMGIACEVAVSPAAQDGPVAVNIQAPNDANLLIGKDGQNLKALEHVTRAFWARTNPGGPPVSIDVNDYRKTKTAELVSMVRTAASRVRDTRRSEALDPMTSYERRVVHTELASYQDLSTESIGQEPYRRVVIKPL